MEEVQELRGPVEVLLHDEAGVGVVAGSVPRDQTGLVLPFALDFYLESVRHQLEAGRNIIDFLLFEKI